MRLQYSTAQGRIARRNYTMARKGYKTATFTLPDGTRKYVTAKTKAELEEKLFELKMQMRMGIDVSDKTTVGELAKIWYDTEKKGKGKQSTQDQWRRLLNNRVLPHIGGYAVKDVNPLVIQNLLNRYQDKCQSDNKRLLQALRGMFCLAVENGMISKSPVLERFKAGGVPTPEKQALTPKQAADLLASLAGTNAELFVRLGLETGMRRGELLGLRWDCVDLENSVVHVRRNYIMLPGYTELSDDLKTPNSRRDLPLTDSTVQLLREKKAKAKSLFVITRRDGRPFDLESFRTFWEAVERRTGTKPQGSRVKHVHTDQPVTPHTLRHTFATRCIESGMTVSDVQALMGHTDPGITLRIYTHYCKETREPEAFSQARKAVAADF